jgi:Arc/MetJ-type ribon-helix-helix transcriptional regulator
MTTQVAVRLPDELADALDSLVDAGWAESRSSVIVAAIRRELRRIQDERDIAILSRDAGAGEFDAMHTHVHSTLTDLDS